MSKDSRVCSCGSASRSANLWGRVVDPAGCFPLGSAPKAGAKCRRDTERTSPSLTSFVFGDVGQRCTLPRRCPQSFAGCRFAVDSDCRTIAGSVCVASGPAS